MSTGAVDVAAGKPSITKPSVHAAVLSQLLTWTLRGDIITDFLKYRWHHGADGHHFAFRFIAKLPQLAQRVVSQLEQSVAGVAEAELFSGNEARRTWGEGQCSWVPGLCGTGAPEVAAGASAYLAYFSSTEYFTPIFTQEPNRSRSGPLMSYASRATWMKPLLDRSWEELLRIPKGTRRRCVHLHVTPQGVVLSIDPGCP